MVKTLQYFWKWCKDLAPECQPRAEYETSIQFKMAGRLALAIRCPKCVLEYTKFINPLIILKRGITSSCPALAGGKYRKKHGKAADSLAYGPLTDLPDWTYLDGTLPPLSLRQVNRQKKRIETATRIVTLLKEINGAKEKSIKSKQGKSTKEQKTS